MVDIIANPEDETTPPADVVQEAENTLDEIESEAGSDSESPLPTGDAATGVIADADNYLVTQATLVTCLGIICETVDNLAGNGLSLAMADGKIPDASDIRRIVSKAMHTSINDRTISFSNAASMGDE